MSILKKTRDQAPEQVQRGSASLAVKAGFWYVISTFLMRSLSFITTPLFSRLMNPADYGEFSNYASWQITLLIITGAELHNTLPRAYYDFTEDYDGYVSAVTIAGCVLTAVCYGLFLACGSWIYQVIAIPEQFVHILFLTLMAQSCKQIFLARERTLYRYKSVTTLSVVNLLSSTLVALALVLLAPENDRLGARIYGTYVPMTLIGITCAVIMVAKGRGMKTGHVKYAFRLALPLMVHYLTAYLLTSTNTIVTKSVLGSEATALVSIVTSAIHILTILLQAVSGAVTTWLMDNLELKKMAQARKGVLLYVAGVAVVSIGIMLVSPELVWILGGKKYAAATGLMPGMVAATFIQSVTTVFTIILTYKKQVVQTAVYTAVVAALSIAAKVLVLNRLGLEALPYVNMVAFAVLYFVGYLLVRKTDCADAVPMKWFNLIVLAVCVVMVACGFLYAHMLVRWGIIGVCAVAVLAVGWRYREMLMKLVRAKLKKKK